MTRGRAAEPVLQAVRQGVVASCRSDLPGLEPHVVITAQRLDGDGQVGEQTIIAGQVAEGDGHGPRTSRLVRPRDPIARDVASWSRDEECRVGADPERRRHTGVAQQCRRLLVAQHDEVCVADEPAGKRLGQPAPEVAGANPDHRHLHAPRPGAGDEQGGVAEQRVRSPPGRWVQRLEHGAATDDDGVSGEERVGDRPRRVGHGRHAVVFGRAPRVGAGHDDVVARSGECLDERPAERLVARVTLPESADEQHG